MAKKKRRKGGPPEGGSPGGGDAATPERREAEAPEAVEPAVEVDVALPSWRWHLGVFLACLAVAALILWGGYVPLMRYHSSKYMRMGDDYLAWAKKFDEEPGRADTFAQYFDGLNRHIAPMAKTGRDFMVAFMADQLPMGEVDNETTTAFRESFRRYVDEMRVLKEVIDTSALETHLFENLPQMKEMIEDQYAIGADAVKRLADEMPLTRPNNRFYWPFYERFTKFLEGVLQYRNCFDRETALDQAMSAYLDAVAFGRRWAPPRMKLADLYALREWGDMAGEEYAKVVRIDPRGAGEEAVGKIRVLAEKDPEVNFHLGVAHLCRGEYPEAAAAFQAVVEWTPAGLYGPKAEELAALARSGNRRRIEQFLGDQVFL